MVELISWKHEDWRKEVTLTVRTWGDLGAGKSQSLFGTPCLLSLSPPPLSALPCLCRSLILSSAARTPPCSWGGRLPAVLGEHHYNVGTSPQRRNWCRDQKTRESYWDSQQQKIQIKTKKSDLCFIRELDLLRRRDTEMLDSLVSLKQSSKPDFLTFSPPHGARRVLG